MKYLDTHCHVFPDEIAKKAMDVLTQNCDYIPVTDGTLTDTIEKQNAWGCKQFVMLNIATSPKSVPKVNDFLIAHNDNRKIFSFGTIHPGFIDYKEELARLEKAKIKGIKFHCGYQDFVMDDKKMYPIYEEIAKRNMILLFHGGYDPGFEGLDHCYADRCKNIVRDFHGAKIIMAHMGNVLDNRLSMQFLLGMDVYFDVSMATLHMPKNQMEQLIKAHGVDKFLYATDSPWSDGFSVQKVVNSLNITDGDKEKIFYKNAAKLLDIKEGDVV
jgi:hypothetical protein